MKFILLLTVFSLSLLGSSAQVIFKEQVQLPKPEKQAGWKDSVNILVNRFMTARDFNLLKEIQTILNRDALLKASVVKKETDSLRGTVDSVLKLLSDDSPNAVKALDSLKLEELPAEEDAEGDKTGTGCAELEKVSNIVVRKDIEGHFKLSFVDAKDNPVSGFDLLQFDQTFFYDRVEKTLLGLCGKAVPAQKDTAAVKKLVDLFKKKELYQHMLEAGLAVNDDDVYAGRLLVRKHIILDTLFTKRQRKLLNEIKTESQPKQNTAQPSAINIDRFLNDSPPIWAKVPNLSLNRGTRRQPSIFFTQGNLKTNRSLRFASTQQYFNPSRDSAKARLLKTIFLAGQPFTVHSIQIQFQDGFIENIKVRGKLDDSSQLLKFENRFPLPFSTRRDYRKMYDQTLVETTIYGDNKFARIRLGDLLDYDQNLDLDTKDYSPANVVLTEEIKEKEQSFNLKKELTSKILELKIFTDLKGIEQNNPNGLVQMELSKKLNFWNNRRSFIKNLFNIGLLNHFTPQFTLNKIEDKAKRLPLQYIGSREPDTSRPNTYASTLQLFQHQVFTVGGDLSVLTLDIPGFKSMITAHAGLYFGRTLTVDTMRSKEDSMTFKAIEDNNLIESGVNSIQFRPGVSWQVFPERRYSVRFSFWATRYKILTDDLAQVRDSSYFRSYIKGLSGDRSLITQHDKGYWLGTGEVFAVFKPSKYNQLFFRYRLNYVMRNKNSNFHQVQLGFNTYLTHTRKEKKEEE